MKDFSVWMDLKKKLDEKMIKPPHVSVGDIWWVSTGSNIGSEVDGKGERNARPAVILKKLSHGFYFVVPTTTKNKEGNWYVPFYQKGVLIRYAPLTIGASGTN
jgi:mRNA interferase MazF